MLKKSLLKEFQPIQILAIGGFIFSLIASLCSIFMQEEWSGMTIIPYYKIVIPITNIISTIVCIVIFIFPEKHFFLYFVLLFQAVFTSLTGYESLGIFLFSLCIVLIILNASLPIKKQKLIIPLLYLFFTIVLLGVIPYGKERFSMAVGCTYFFASAFYCIVLTYKKKLKNVMPLIQKELFISHKIYLPNPGEPLNLNDFDLTDRQKQILFEVIANNKSYGEVTLSTRLTLPLVKKEMAAIIQYFGCKNVNSLKLVLCQYVITL